MPEIDPRVKRDIADHGWHVVKVMEDATGPGHAFTIGLHETHGHPEIVVVGPNLDVLHQLVNAVGEDVRAGRRFEAGQGYDGILSGMRCEFREVHLANYGDFLGYAGWYYEGAPFPALQCVWPDPEGRFPWEDGAPAELLEWQPDLAQPFKAA
ncbi:MAG: DUF4262 domain-containing protein [Deltaproteobacteria bacterium]|nr:DUF4262 domain-containing protein [Deltaproteobacteria bacterium]MBW2448288.1 DUF4262 domain-containing protein [Deltaproteobacteria bacterium]